MILEIAIGDTVCVRFDDELTDNPPNPELVEDYLTRMGRTATRMWDGMADAPATTTSDDEQP